jgi:hypothetical protein
MLDAPLKPKRRLLSTCCDREFVGSRLPLQNLCLVNEMNVADQLALTIATPHSQKGEGRRVASIHYTETLKTAGQVH